jgi:hypothetical protein
MRLEQSFIQILLLQDQAGGYSRLVYQMRNKASMGNF